jgi:hypothetical protein
MRARTGVALGAAVVLLGAVVLLVAAESVPGLIEVKERGRNVLPIDSPVAKIRVAGAFDMYVDLGRGEVEDTVVGVLLSTMATASLMCGILLSAAGSPRRLSRFYLTAAAGTGFLALDELLSLHETLGHNLRPLFPGVEKPDNLIMILYPLGAVAALFVFRRELLRRGLSRMLFAASAAVFALSVIFDNLDLRGEEHLELLAAGCAGLAFLNLLVTDLRQGLGLGERGRVKTADGV